MTEKQRILNLTSVMMFHAEELVRYVMLYGDCMTEKQREHTILLKERYLRYAEEISEGIIHLRRTGEIT